MTAWQNITSDIILMRDWIGLIISQLFLGPGTMMLIKGTMPPPFTNRKANPVLATSLLVIGILMLLVFGQQDLLERTIAKFTS